MRVTIGYCSVSSTGPQFELGLILEGPSSGRPDFERHLLDSLPRLEGKASVFAEAVLVLVGLGHDVGHRWKLTDHKKWGKPALAVRGTIHVLPTSAVPCSAWEIGDLAHPRSCTIPADREPLVPGDERCRSNERFTKFLEETNRAVP